ARLGRARRRLRRLDRLAEGLHARDRRLDAEVRVARRSLRLAGDALGRLHLRAVLVDRLLDARRVEAAREDRHLKADRPLVAFRFAQRRHAEVGPPVDVLRRAGARLLVEAIAGLERECRETAGALDRDVVL